MSKILFLTTAHNYNDDRIFFHQAKELVDKGFEVKICSLYSEFSGNLEGIKIESFDILKEPSNIKIDQFKEVCYSYRPDCIICSEPLAVIAASEYAKKHRKPIVYDITEWYPSMRMIKPYGFALKYVHAVKFLMIQLYAGFLSDLFIFGENSKKFPLAYIFPWKKSLMLPYYPNSEYVEKNIKEIDQEKINLCYTGSFSKEKGIDNFFKAADAVRKKRPDIKVFITLIGSSRSDEDALHFKSLLNFYRWDHLKVEKPVSFEKFSQSYADADICFDLREVNIENHNCLPIKIFYYMASGKPVIYSHLKATKDHLDVSRFGYLVDPANSDEISNHILNYIDHPELYTKHAENARKDFEEKYNWGAIRNSFVNFIKKSLVP